MSWARPVAGSLALLITFAALPAASAAEAPSGAAKASLATAVAAKVGSLKATPRAFQTATQGNTNTVPDDRSFLSTGRGKAALVLMAAGLGYAVYSAFKDNDAVHSPIR